MVRTCLAVMLVLGLVALVSGCGDDGSLALPSSYAGTWTGMLHIGEQTVAMVTFTVGNDGNVYSSGTVDTPNGTYQVNGGSVNSQGAIELLFGPDNSGHFLAGTSTYNSNVLTGSGGYTAPGEAKQIVQFQLTRQPSQ